MSTNNFYTEDYYRTLEEGTRRSAREIVALVLELTRPQSVVDVGCGLGTWLSVFEQFGIDNYLGIDGDHIDPNNLEIPRDRFLSFDLRNPLQVDTQFDLVVSLEVAEHLPSECAETFIDSITSLGPVVLFSAATPLQQGENHINGQWPHYWVQRFQKRGYLVVDCLRKRIWNNENVEPWYAQNILIFVRQDQIARYPLLERELENTDVSHLAMVHPNIPRQDLTRAYLPGNETTHAVRVEVTEPLPDISPPKRIERLHCTVELEGTSIGAIQLPVCEGFVPRHVLADVIAAEFAWPIIGRFFEHTVYHDLSVEREPTGISVWRGDLRLADGLSDNGERFWAQAHNRIGWAVFLQEVWLRPGWPSERFFDPQAADEAAARRRVADGWFTAEISEDLPDLEVSAQELDVLLTVGGVALGVVTIPVEQDIVRAQELRAALTGASGFELCRAAVREGLLGRPLAEPASLRDRLVAAASATAQFPGWLGAPGSTRALGELSPAEPQVVLGRRIREPFGTSASRRAILPASVAHELVNAAATADEPVVQVPRPGEKPARVVYAPDLIWRPSKYVPEPYQPPRYEQTLAPIRTTRIARALELACAEAYPTPQIASQVLTDSLPILVYHRITPAGSPATNRYRVSPEAFEGQLQYLRDAGYYSVTLEEWHVAMVTRKPLPGRAVLITFDGGYLDFLTYAWPLLKHYGFSATVFLVVDEVGKSNGWDRVYGKEVSLLDWKQIHRLQDEGVRFGSCSATHRPLTSLSLAEVVREGARSRAILNRAMGIPIKAFAYPYGDTDRVIEQLIGACGYVFGLSCRPGRSQYDDSLLALPRIEVTGSDNLQEFGAKFSL